MNKSKTILLFSLLIYQVSFSQNLKSDTLSIIFNQKGCFSYQYQNLSVIKKDTSAVLYFNGSFNENQIDSLINFDMDTNFHKILISHEKLKMYNDFKDNILNLKKDTLYKSPTITYIIIENGQKQVIKANNPKVDFYLLMQSVTGLYFR